MPNCVLVGDIHGEKKCERCGRTTRIARHPSEIKMRCGVEAPQGYDVATSYQFPQRPDADADSVKPMSAWEKAKSFGRSIAAFALDGMAMVDATEYDRRLTICDACKHRSGSSCSICGCRLALKAKGRAFSCPLGRWTSAASPPASRTGP